MDNHECHYFSKMDLKCAKCGKYFYDHLRDKFMKENKNNEILKLIKEDLNIYTKIECIICGKPKGSFYHNYDPIHEFDKFICDKCLYYLKEND